MKKNSAWHWDWKESISFHDYHEKFFIHKRFFVVDLQFAFIQGFHNYSTIISFPLRPHWIVVFLFYIYYYFKNIGYLIRKGVFHKYTFQNCTMEWPNTCCSLLNLFSQVLLTTALAEQRTLSCVAKIKAKGRVWFLNWNHRRQDSHC